MVENESILKDIRSKTAQIETQIQHLQKNNQQRSSFTHHQNDHDEQIASLRQQASSLMDSCIPHTRPYLLHALLIHIGDVHFGHYQIYIKDHVRGVYLKMDDSIVREVLDPADEVFGDTTGRDGNAYSLVYVEEGKVGELVGI